MNAYYEKAITVLQDRQQTYQAKWIATQILTNAGYSEKTIELLRDRKCQQSLTTLSA